MNQVRKAVVPVTSQDTAVSGRWNRRNVALLAIAAALLFTCGLTVFWAWQQLRVPIYPGSTPYLDPEQGCLPPGLVYCYNIIKVRTSDSPEAIAKYFRDNGSQVTAFKTDRARPNSAYSYYVLDEGNIRVGPFAYFFVSRTVINNEYIGDDETAIIRIARFSLYYVR